MLSHDSFEPGINLQGGDIIVLVVRGSADDRITDIIVIGVVIAITIRVMIGATLSSARVVTIQEIPRVDILYGNRNDVGQLIRKAQQPSGSGLLFFEGATQWVRNTG